MQMPELVFTKTISESLRQYCALSKITNAIVLCDTNTQRCCLPLIAELNLPVIECEAGENSKSFEEVIRIIDKLIDLKADRQTVLINLGGGMVTDLGGFVASIYKRGIPFINIPTSLLGMVDAGIGGKTGIDYLNYKNIVGVFKQANAIFISTEFLKTLPEEDYKSAWSEIIKTAAVANESLFELIESDGNLDVRQLLNFGHTFGHAYESYFLEIDKPIKHGFAVAYGMRIELKIALFINNISANEFERINKLLNEKLGVVEDGNDLFNLYLKYIASDKKNVDSNVIFSLPKSIGKGQYQYKVSIEQLKKWKIEGII